MHRASLWKAAATDVQTENSEPAIPLAEGPDGGEQIQAPQNPVDTMLKLLSRNLKLKNADSPYPLVEEQNPQQPPKLSDDAASPCPKITYLDPDPRRHRVTEHLSKKSSGKPSATPSDDPAGSPSEDTKPSGEASATLSDDPAGLPSEDTKPSGEASATLSDDPASSPPKETKSQSPDVKLGYSFSTVIGRPTHFFDPKEVELGYDLCPTKMGARIRLLRDRKAVVKYGKKVRLAEAEALHLVNTKTTIHAPKLDVAYIENGIGYIAMSYEPGEDLESAYYSASDEGQKNIMDQLKSAMTQMRSFKGEFIGGLDRSPCLDGIFDGDWIRDRYTYGPFDSEAAFNEGIVQALENRMLPEMAPKDSNSDYYVREQRLKALVRSLKGHEVVFTHGDLHSGNILVQKDGRVVFLDWGLAGYWPDYWEFYRALFQPPDKPSWELEVEKFVPPFFIERMVIQTVFNVIWA